MPSEVFVPDMTRAVFVEIPEDTPSVLKYAVKLLPEPLMKAPLPSPVEEPLADISSSF